jgi:hypothetical protein
MVVATQTLTDEQMQQRKREQQREANRKKRARMLGLTDEEYAERVAEWHSRQGKAAKTNNEAADRHAALWCQMRRIERWLPELYQQRDEAVQRLSEITDLIADEEAAAAEIRASFE